MYHYLWYTQYLFFLVMLFSTVTKRLADLILLNPMKFAFVVNATAQRRQRDILAIVFRTDHFLTTMVAQTKRRDKEDLPYTHTYVSSFYVYILSILDILFSSNHNIHKSAYSLCFGASDPLIDGF